jgi:hypothetical protein
MSPRYYNLVLIILIGIFGYEIAYPMYTGDPSFLYTPSKSYKSLLDLSSNYDASLNQADVVIKQSKDLSDKYKSVTDTDKELLSIMIPDSIDEVRLLSEISSLVHDAGYPSDGVTIQKRGISERVSGAGTYNITLTIEEVSYPKIKEFIRKIERSKRLLSIKAISIAPPEKLGEAYKVSFSLETYYFKNDDK